MSSNYIKSIYDFQIEARKGKVPNHTIVRIQGHSNDVGTNTETLMPGTGSISPDTLAATPSTVKVASTSANDTAAGTGARTVLLSGLDSSGLAQSETITLNGQTEVTSSGTYKWVQSVLVTTAGSGLVNAGTLWVGTGTFTSGVPAVKLCSAEVGANVSTLGAYMVPAGKTFYVQQVAIALGDASSGRFLTLGAFIKSVTTGLYVKVQELVLPAGSHIYPTFALAGQPAGTILEYRVSVSTGTASVNAAIAGVLVTTGE